MLMTAAQSSLLIVDVQEKLCPVMDDPAPSSTIAAV